MEILTQFKSRKYWVQIISIWVLYTILETTRFYFAYQTNTPWWLFFFAQLPIWILWALSTPLITYVIYRYPIAFNNRKSILINVLFGLVLMTLLTSIYQKYNYFIWGSQPWTGKPFLDYLPYFIQRFIYQSITYIFVYLIIYWHRYYSLKKDQELNVAQVKLINQQLENQLTSAHLMSLKMQLNPHFLFNTLNSVSALVYDKPKLAVDVIAKLGELLRVALSKDSSFFWSLESECVFLNNYLEIELMRFEDRLKVIMEIEPGVQKALVPIMLFQPIVENALIHGANKGTEMSKISIKIHSEENTLIALISDNGLGLDENTNMDDKGVGLSNTQKRLDIMYPGNHELLFKKNDPKGLTVVIKIPVRFYGEDDELK
jgi:hypothetical protein